jgi:hypothetical protein
MNAFSEDSLLLTIIDISTDINDTSRALGIWKRSGFLGNKDT